MDTSSEAKKQKEQLSKYLKWKHTEGGTEGPTHLDTWFKDHQEKRLKWLKERCWGTVMEAGCNYGYILAYCKGHIGVDYNEKSIELARILNPRKEFVCADIRSLPFSDNHVDTILLTDVLEHLPWDDVAKAIEEAKRVAKTKILVTLPNGDYETAEALSMKHQWLATAEKLMEVIGWFYPWRTEQTCNRHFALIEAVQIR